MAASSFMLVLLFVGVVMWLAFQVIAAAVRKGVREGIADADHARVAEAKAPPRRR